MDKTTVKYLVRTFLLTYFTWGGIAAANQFGYLKFGTPACMILYMLGGWSPTIISYICLKESGKISGIKQFAKEAFNVKQSPKAYLLILVFAALFYVIAFITGQITYTLPFYYAIVMIPAMIFGGGLEELGWRYILQPELEKHLPFAAATAITGCIWALWHLPLFYIVGSLQQSSMSFLPFAIQIFGLAFALAAIRYMSKSIWLCVLFHCVMNASQASFSVNQTILLNTATSALMIIASIAIVSYSKRKNILFAKDPGLCKSPAESK